MPGSAPARPQAAPRVGYLVSRFPSLTETFVLRELQAVEADGGVRLSLMSLFPPLDRTTQPAAEAWIPRRHRPGPAAIARALLGWLVRRPVRTAGTLGRVVLDHRRRPRVLLKALVTTGVGLAQAAHVRRSGVEHVHAHFAAMPALAAWTIHRLTGATYSVTPHAHDVFIHQEGLRTRLSGASFVVAISTFHRELLARHGADPARLPVIGMGIDLREHAYRPPSRDRARPPRLLMVSSFKEYKGHRYLVEALAQEPRLADARLELVGTGPLRAAVEEQVRGLGLADRVTFAGPQPAAAVLARLRDADVLVQPSVVQADGDTEGLPTTLVEGAACGVSLVATRVAGVPDLVRDGETGALAEPRDARGLADALLRVLDLDDAALERMRGAARAHVEEHHDATRAAATLVAWFRAARTPRPPRPEPRRMGRPGRRSRPGRAVGRDG
jgi:glycosyltransferase involved in cell wall biosynthesis